MRLTRFLLLGVIFALWASPSILPAAPAPNPAAPNVNVTVRAIMSSLEEVPTLLTSGRGEFRARILGNATIHYRLSYSDLEGGAVSAVHVHLGRAGVNGGVIALLCGGEGKPVCPSSGTVTGVLRPTDVVGPAAQGIGEGEFPEALRAILDGAAYINLHTDAYRPGEIRGQVLPVPRN